MTRHFAVHPVIEGCLEAFRRCETVLDAMPKNLFADSNSPTQPIGAQLRHCLDHAKCLLAGLERGEIDYDARPRDPSEDTDPEVFRRALRVAYSTAQHRSSLAS